MSLALNEQQTGLLISTIAALGEEHFCARLLAFMHACLEFDSAVMMAYPDDALLVLHDELDAGDRAGFDGPYRSGIYMLSPLYIESRAGNRGYFHISEIAPEGFTDSEFYEIYYSNNDSIDQVAMLLESGTGTAIALSLERTSALRPFSARDKKLLAGLAPLLLELVRKQQWPAVRGMEPGTHTDLHQHVQAVLSLFGSSLLTPREREVVRLILRGYPSKSVARELDISIQTEQVHRKNIYQKLNISSHSELFTLFFAAITVPPVADTDPLLTLRA